MGEKHEQAAKRLGRDLAPIVSEELRQVERIVMQHNTSSLRSGGSSGGISEAQLDELARAVQVELVQPLQMKIKDLTKQVQVLREEALQLGRRISACSLSDMGNRNNRQC